MVYLTYRDVFHKEHHVSMIELNHRYMVLNEGGDIF